MDMIASPETKPDFRILHVARGKYWTDVEIQVLNIARSLNSRAYASCSVVVFNNGKLSEALRKAGVDVVVFDESRIRPYVLMQHVARVIRAFNPMVVHTHGRKENLIGSLAARSAKTGVSVRTAHAEKPAGMTPDSRKPSSLVDFMDRQVARHLQRSIFFVSREQARHSSLNDGEIKNPIVIPESVDLRSLSVLRKARPWSSRSVKVCYLAELGNLADVEMFAKTARDFWQQYDIDSRFDAYGITSHQDQLKLSGAPNLRLIGPNPDRARTLRDYDYLIVPAVHESTPVAVLEAMSLGVGVIAKNGVSMADTLNHGECGSLIDSANPDSFARAIADSVRDTRKLRSVTLEHAARRVAELYDSDAQCNRLLEQYRAVTSESEFWRIYQPQAVRS